MGEDEGEVVEVRVGRYGPFLSKGEVRASIADDIAAALGDNKAAILQNHGLLTVGGSVDEAAWWFITMERSCQAQLLAEAAGASSRDTVADHAHLCVPGRCGVARRRCQAPSRPSQTST